MVWLIIGVIAALALVIYVWCEEIWVGVFTCIVESMAVIFAAGAITLIVIMASSAIASAGENVIEYNQVSDTHIIALKDNQNINGSFYIMGGYVDEDLYYYYATETEFGYKTEKIKADNAYIKYTDGETHIEKYDGDFVNRRRYFWGFPMCSSRYIIYVPEGTITNEFDIDLE